jgi:hypothetical protein
MIQVIISIFDYLITLLENVAKAPKTSTALVSKKTSQL